MSLFESLRSTFRLSGLAQHIAWTLASLAVVRLGTLIVGSAA